MIITQLKWWFLVYGSCNTLFWLWAVLLREKAISFGQVPGEITFLGLRIGAILGLAAFCILHRLDKKEIK